MAGLGAAPFNSSWNAAARARIGSAYLYSRIAFGDVNTNEGTLWRAWFFGAATTDLMPSMPLLYM